MVSAEQQSEYGKAVARVRMKGFLIFLGEIRRIYKRLISGYGKEDSRF